MMGPVVGRRRFAPTSLALRIVGVAWLGSIVSASAPSQFSSNHGSTSEQRSRFLNVEETPLAVSLSAWHPKTDISDVEDLIKEALQLFLCEETGFIVVDDTYRTVCSHSSGTATDVAQSSDVGGSVTTDSGNESTMEEFLSRIDQSNSYLSNEPTSIRFTAGHEGGIHWTSWRVMYEVFKVGELFVEQATMVNVSDPLLYMQNVTQLALDVSILEGTMDTRLKRSGVVLSVTGDEYQTFGTASDDDVQTTEVDFGSAAAVLRYIGLAILLVNFTAVFSLTWLARRRRLAKEQDLTSQGRESEENKGLVTEQGVNRMLDIGRKESERMLKRASSKLLKDRSGATEVMDVPLGGTSSDGEKSVEIQLKNSRQADDVESPNGADI